ncbi:hypothetical protein LTR81_027801, partial [Elasticomyces elasticus]
MSCIIVNTASTSTVLSALNNSLIAETVSSSNRSSLISSWTASGSLESNVHSASILVTSTSADILSGSGTGLNPRYLNSTRLPSPSPALGGPGGTGSVLHLHTTSVYGTISSSSRVSLTVSPLSASVVKITNASGSATNPTLTAFPVFATSAASRTVTSPSITLILSLGLSTTELRTLTNGSSKLILGPVSTSISLASQIRTLTELDGSTVALNLPLSTTGADSQTPPTAGSTLIVEPLTTSLNSTSGLDVNTLTKPRGYIDTSDLPSSTSVAGIESPINDGLKLTTGPAPNSVTLSS